jgi:hypothetical protein
MSAVPGPVANIANVMSSYGPPWALCGGWAVDAWLGKLTREHGDVDIVIFDQTPLFKHLSDWQLIGHDETQKDVGADLWDGRRLVPPAHLHGRAPEDCGTLPERFDESGMRVLFAEDGFWLDIQICERSGSDWVLEGGGGDITIPLAQCIRQSGWGVPTTTPEVILFHKATMYPGTKNYLRPRDEADLHALLPHVSDGEREWLRETISQVQPGHPWLARI